MATETQFKQSNVGIIPAVWDVSSIGDQCQIFGRIGFRGYTKNDIVNKNQGAITLSPSNIINGELNLEKVTFLSWFKYEESPEIKIYKGDILLVKTGSTYGKTTFIKDLNKKATLNPQIVVLKNIRCCNQWLGYVMKFNIIQNQIKATIVGGAIPTLSQEQVSNFQIPLPPLPEQEAIAEVLSDTDALITALEKRIAKKRLIKQGTMQTLLTPPARRGGKDDWEVKKLGEIADITSAGVDKKIKPNETPVTLINYMDVYNRDYIYRNELSHIVTAPFAKTINCNVKKGDIFLLPSSETRTDIGTCAISMENMDDAVYSYHILRLRYLIEIDELFGMFMLKTQSFLNQSETLCEGSGKRYVVSMNKFRSMEVFYPKLKDEQTRIATILSDMDSEIDVLEKKLSKTKELKQGLMQQLLTGKIRLV